MGKLRRGGYIFVTWVGDHPPRHVHVYKNGRLVVKYDLERARVMKGVLSNTVKKLIAKLTREGRL